MSRTALTFRLKGNRDYVQAGDMFNVLCERLPQVLQSRVEPPFKLIVHKFARKQCDLLICENESSSRRPEALVAEFACGIESGRLVGWLVETDRPIEERYEYDEAKIQSLSLIADNAITIAQNSGYSPMEVAVSLTKRIHHALYPTAGRWIFTRIDLTRFFLPGDSRSMRIRVELNFNNRMTKSSIQASEEVIGHIYFSRVES
jgi:hypothetical protein